MPELTTTFELPTNQSGIGIVAGRLTTNPPWYEVDGYKEQFRQDDIQATRMFRVPWGVRGPFVEAMLGYSYSVTQNVLAAGGGGALAPPLIKRLIPAQHPERPWLYADSVELVKGEGAIRNGTNYQARDANGNILNDANGQPITLPFIEYFDNSGQGEGCGLYAVRYTFRDYEIRTDDDLTQNFNGYELNRWVTVKRKYSAQNLPLPGNGVQFTAGPYQGSNISQTGLGIIIALVDYEYRWHQVPDVPEAALDNCVGLINQATFDGVSGRRSFPPGTLLCMPPSVDRIRTATGRVAWEIAYHLLYRKTGWNTFPAADGNFYPVSRLDPNGNATGIPVYGSADFSTLFAATTPDSYQ